VGEGLLRHLLFVAVDDVEAGFGEETSEWLFGQSHSLASVTAPSRNAMKRRSKQV
jgi:hypothetical protein